MSTRVQRRLRTIDGAATLDADLNFDQVGNIWRYVLLDCDQGSVQNDEEMSIQGQSDDPDL